MEDWWTMVHARSKLARRRIRKAQSTEHRQLGIALEQGVQERDGTIESGTFFDKDAFSLREIFDTQPYDIFDHTEGGFVHIPKGSGPVVAEYLHGTVDILGGVREGSSRVEETRDYWIRERVAPFRQEPDFFMPTREDVKEIITSDDYLEIKLQNRTVFAPNKGEGPIYRENGDGRLILAGYKTQGEGPSISTQESYRENMSNLAEQVETVRELELATYDDRHEYEQMDLNGTQTASADPTNVINIVRIGGTGLDEVVDAAKGTTYDLTKGKNGDHLRTKTSTGDDYATPLLEGGFPADLDLEYVPEIVTLSNLPESLQVAALEADNGIGPLLGRLPVNPY